MRVLLSAVVALALTASAAHAQQLRERPDGASIRTIDSAGETYAVWSTSVPLTELDLQTASQAVRHCQAGFRMQKLVLAAAMFESSYGVYSVMGLLNNTNGQPQHVATCLQQASTTGSLQDINVTYWGPTAEMEPRRPLD